jgi:hypothetical protein
MSARTKANININNLVATPLSVIQIAYFPHNKCQREQITVANMGCSLQINEPLLQRFKHQPLPVSTRKS